MKLNEAVSQRLQELLQERGMTQYQLSMQSGLPKSTIGNIVNCQYDSMKLRKMCIRDRYMVIDQGGIHCRFLLPCP